MMRLCLQWPRFGPYHWSRLDAVHAFLSERDATLVALETAGRDATYGWHDAQSAPPYDHVRVFQDATAEALSPDDVFDAVTAVLDRMQPDAVGINSYSQPDALACLAWCRRRRRTAVVMTDSKADDAPRAAWREALKGRLVQQFDAALVAGTPHRAYLADLGLLASRIVTGYDVVDNAYFEREAETIRRDPASARALPGLDDPTPYFLASSRFLARKNLPVLLDAYRRYRARHDAPWRLVLLGDGPLRSDLEQQIERDGIGGVTLPGFRSFEELPAYYALAGAFVHPAVADQWGLVVNEAMAAGLPVLVSTGAGCAIDLVEDGGNGYRFVPDDPTALAEHLHTIATLPDADRRRMAERSQAIIADYTPALFAERLWEAVELGRPHRDRGLGLPARLLLAALRRAPRADTFHSVEA